MKQEQLAEKVELIKWQQTHKKQYPLLTLHSLLIDHHPHFQALKQLLEDHNLDKQPTRIKPKQQFLDRLFERLSQLVSIHNHEHMLAYLEKIWAWVHHQQPPDETDLQQSKAARPTTATTKTRAMSAHSKAQRPSSGIATIHGQRPTSAYHPQPSKQSAMRPMSAQMGQKLGLEPTMDRRNKKIDYSKLKEGEREFYTGARTIHPLYEHPKKLLKDYQRKIFYEQPDDSDIQEIEFQKPPQPKLPDIEIAEEQLLVQEEDVEGQGQGDDVEGDGDQVVNIDDIPIEGEEGGQPEVEEEPKEIIDKLRPKTKSYAPVRNIAQVDPHHYQAGQKEVLMKHHIGDRRAKEDEIMKGMQTKQAQNKGRMNSELRRRAESARMITKRVGVPVSAQKKEESGAENMVNFENVQPALVNTKGWRPTSAFVATNPAKRDALIKKAFISGSLHGHVGQVERPETVQSIPSQFNVVGTSLASQAPKPKKKTFEDIMREAEDRVVREAQEEVMAVKEAFARNKISIGANKVMKSITYGGKQIEGDDFAGGIIGMNMPSNPFFKVAKKKKKKKKR